MNLAHRQITFGKRDNNKPHKTILMVGETGTGKTTLINVMINYMLGVQREDKVWFEITDDQSDHQSSVHSQTSIITVYEINLQESPTDLTIIDTPGYGDTRDTRNNKEIALSLLDLSRCDRVQEIHTVCLVIKATENRLSDRQLYIFNAVQSLFGKKFAENIVLLFTHSDGFHPKNVLAAVKEAQVKSAVNDQNEPVFFQFNNHQSEAADEKYENIKKIAWQLSFNAITQLFRFIENIKAKSLKMTEDVLKQRKQLEAKISNLESRVNEMVLKQSMKKQTQEALKQNEEYVTQNKNFEYEVKVSYKEKVRIDPKMWLFTRKAMCCTFCEENCHYPGCWWVNDLSWCSVMKDDHCTVCTNKCHYSEHVKIAKIYETKKKTEKRTYEELKKEYEGKIGDGESLVKKLEEELLELEKEKIKLVIEAFDCVEKLLLIALNTDSLLILEHVDILIERLIEINELDKSQKLEDSKNRARKKKGAMKYLTKTSK